jgi:hypothetical protein
MSAASAALARRVMALPPMSESIPYPAPKKNHAHFLRCPGLSHRRNLSKIDKKAPPLSFNEKEMERQALCPTGLAAITRQGNDLYEN